MQTKTFHYKEAVLHYAVYPGGKDTLLAFHGFGQSYSYFAPLSHVLASEYTMYSIDLFYHGQSLWPDSNKPITKAFWKELMAAFLREQQIEKFSLAGFSLGGKFVLATFEAFPASTDCILFIAPDGIRTSFWYNLATYPSWARNYFKKIVDKPESFFRLLRIFKKLQVVDEGIIRFAHYQMSGRHQREKVYNTWVMSRELKFDMPKIARLINDHQVKISMYLGRYDKIMTQRGMKRLLRHIHKYDLQVLETGHNRLIDKVAHFLKSPKS